MLQDSFISVDRQAMEQGPEACVFRTSLRFATIQQCMNWLDNRQRRRHLLGSRARGEPGIPAVAGRRYTPLQAWISLLALAGLLTLLWWGFSSVPITGGR